MNIEEFDPLAHNYLIWRDSYGNEVQIFDLETDHIKACIGMIKARMPKNPERYRKTAKRPTSAGDIGSPTWCAYYGDGYLKELRKELKERLDRDKELL